MKKMNKMKKLVLAALVLFFSMNLFAGCEVTTQLDPNLAITLTNKDASWLVGWLDHALNGHDDDD